MRFDTADNCAGMVSTGFSPSTADQTAFSDAQGNDAADDWQLLHGGFRSDWSLSKRNDLTVQGDIYKGNEGQTVSGLISLSPPVSGSFYDRTNVSGGNLLGRWTRTSSERFDTSVQAYFEIADRSQLGVLGEFRHTIDLETGSALRAGPAP